MSGNHPSKYGENARGSSRAHDPRSRRTGISFQSSTTSATGKLLLSLNARLCKRACTRLKVPLQVPLFPFGKFLLTRNFDCRCYPEVAICHLPRVIQRLTAILKSVRRFVVGEIKSLAFRKWHTSGTLSIQQLLGI